MKIFIPPMVLLALASGCREHLSSAIPTTTVSDSAGVAIVSSVGPRFPVRYRVDSTPVLDLGAGGDLADEFSGTVIALRLRDGGIVVANQGTSEVRFFGADGKRLQTVGRKGAGPGEFEQIASLAAGAGDSLLVFDRNTRRLTVISPARAIVRSAQIPLGDGKEATAMFGTLPGGGILVSPARSGLPPAPSGLIRDSVDLRVVRAGGQSVVGRFPGREALIQVESQGKTIVSVNIAGMPFARTALFATSDTLVVVAPSDRYEYALYSASGRLLRRVRRAHTPEPITEADRDALLAKENLPNEDAKARYRNFLKLAPLATTKPAYDRVLPGANGELWIRDYLEPYQRQRPGRWTIFDRDGAWLSTVELPTGFDPTWIGPDHILGTWLDPDDAPHVRLFRLLR